MGKLSDAAKAKQELLESALAKNEVLFKDIHEREWHRAPVSALDDVTIDYLRDMTVGKYSIEFGSFAYSATGNIICVAPVIYFEQEMDKSMFVMFYEVRKGNGDKF